MDIFKTVTIVTVLLVGFTYCQDTNCSTITRLEECCAETNNCTFCKADNTSDAVCLSPDQKGDQCTIDVCAAEVSTEAPPITTSNITVTTATPGGETTTPSNQSIPTATPTPLPSNLTSTTSTPPDNGTSTLPPASSTTPESTSVTDGPTTSGNGTTTPAGTTTPSGTTANGTTPALPPPDAPCPEGQHFDAASFIGGMILCGGVIAIVFFGCKFYQSRSERKYQQF